MASLIELVKELRERTGAGFADCKKALESTGEDLEKAIDWLREKGIAKSAAKAGRVAAEGLAKVLVEGNKAVIVEVNSETDFTARNEKFKELVDLVANTLLKNHAETLEEALDLPTADGKLSEAIAALSFATGEKMTLRRFEEVTKND
ncbi:MAG: translation elongation factor Ts, partial [Erysipelotrichaceae bacterium]|nr:translation elongation factor Ts [Erysipelotrichaceae bacterium]